MSNAALRLPLKMPLHLMDRLFDRTVFVSLQPKIHRRLKFGIGYLLMLRKLSINIINLKAMFFRQRPEKQLFFRRMAFLI